MSSSGETFFITGGTLRQDAACYVERRADIDLLEGLLKGEFCYVLTSRQMGKSSLMVRTAGKLREHGAQVIALDLTAIGQNLTPEQWYDGLMLSGGRQLRLEDELEDFWQAHARLSPVQRLINAIREVALVKIPGRLVIFVDEIDVVRSLPFPTDEFFAAMRECYNRRTQDPELNRLSFCLLGVAAPAELIRDAQNTPFNIGRRIQLNDFTPEEAAPLAKGLSIRFQVSGFKSSAAEFENTQHSTFNSQLLNRILHWTNGHPYLTQRLCKAVTEASDIVGPTQVDGLCEELFLSHRARERDDNLLFVRERILRSRLDLGALLTIYGRVHAGLKVRDDETNALMDVLRLAGITGVADGCLQVRNRIYHRVFDDEWIQTNLPKTVVTKAAPDSASTEPGPFWQQLGSRRWAIAAVVALLAAGSGLFFWLRERPLMHAASSGPASVAVLPFVNMSADKDNEYFSDGITEEILNALARTPGLRVAARTSAFSFKGKNESVQRIGEALKVGVVLEGSVRRAGNQLRITAQLINVADGFPLWSDSFDRKAEDVFAIQREVAQRVQEVLKLKLLAGSSTNTLLAGTDNLKAYDLYLRGRHFWNERTGADLERALGLFQQATEADPSFAAAYAGLASSYVLLPLYARVPVRDAIPKARAAARRALELDGRLAEPHAVLGYCADLDWDPAGADQEYQTALRLNPNHGTSHHWYAGLLRDQGKTDQALAEIGKAQMVDPLAAIIPEQTGGILWTAGRHEEALLEADKSLKLSPDFPPAYHLRGRVFLAQKKIPEAIAEFEKVRKKTGDTPYALGHLGHAYARAGRTNEARQILEKLTSVSASGGSASFDIAFVHLGLGELDRAFVLLERGAESRDLDPRTWKVSPIMGDVVKDPRYVALLKKFGLDK